MKPTDIDRTVAQLGSLSERELIEVLSRVFAEYARKFDASEDRGDRYVLVRSAFEKGEDAEPFLQFMGLPSERYLGYDQNAAYENGACPTCGVTVACVDKLATCPVCGTTGVECT